LYYMLGISKISKGVVIVTVRPARLLMDMALSRCAVVSHKR
jgi:hypothetical protein